MDRAYKATKLIALVWIISVGALTAQQLPGIPNAPIPSNNSINVATTQVLSWRSDGATLGYDVYFGTAPSPPWVGKVQKPTYSPVGLLPSTKYYFRVVARNANGAKSSAVWTFTTGSSSTPKPIDCVLSVWTLKSATPWSACTGGVQTRTETWSRTIIVPPSNGGKACGPLTEQRTASQSCGPPPASPGGVLLTSTDLTYDGAFRVPLGTGTQSFQYGGTALSYNPAHNSLLIVGHDWYQMVGEISLPTPVKGAVISALPRASIVQPLTDVLKGKLKTIDGNTTNGVKIGGLVVLPSSMVVSAWSYYDAGAQKQTKSHFATGVDFASLPGVTGPFQVGTGFQDIVPADTTRIAGFVSGYMSTIPGVWQSALGGTHLTGQGGGISIVTRTSSGPSATVFTPSELGVPNTPTKLVMGYPSDSNHPSGPLNHPALGVWGVQGGLYNGTQAFRGMVFPEGTRSVLFFGWGGSTFCYGAGTDDPSLHGTPHPQGGVWCYDPANNGKGTHGYPYSSIVWAYDADDFLRVRAGTLQPWDVKPYATWNLSLPFQSGRHEIAGVAYDPATKRLFLSAAFSEGVLPVIHVFNLP